MTLFRRMRGARGDVALSGAAKSMEAKDQQTLLLAIHKENADQARHHEVMRKDVTFESYRGHPRIHDLRVLSRRQMRRPVQPTGKQKLIARELRLCDPGLHGFMRFVPSAQTEPVDVSSAA